MTVVKVVANSFADYKSIQTFRNLDELNAWEVAVKSKYKFDFTKSERKILDFMLQYATKFIGVFYMKYPNAIKKLGISLRTFYNALTKFEGLGLINRVDKILENGKPRGKAIVFIPLPVSPVDNSNKKQPHEPAKDDNCTADCTPSAAPQPSEGIPCESKDERAKTAGDTPILYTPIIKDLKDLKQSTEYTLDSYIPSYVPKTFVHCCSFTNTGEIIHFWKTFYNEWNKRPILYKIESRKEEIAIECGQAYFYAYKQKRLAGEQVENTGGLFCGIAKNILSDYEQDLSKIQVQATQAKGMPWLIDYDFIGA